MHPPCLVSRIACRSLLLLSIRSWKRSFPLRCVAVVPFNWRKCWRQQVSADGIQGWGMCMRWRGWRDNIKNVDPLKNKKPTKDLSRLLKSFTFVKFQSVMLVMTWNIHIERRFHALIFDLLNLANPKLREDIATKASTWYDYIIFVLTNEQLASRNVYHMDVGYLALLILWGGNARAKKVG